MAGPHDTNDDRDYTGYGATPPDPHWPNGARLAININLNFEAGGERSLMDGDATSEGMLTDIGQPNSRDCAATSSNRRSNMAPGSGPGGCWRRLAASA